MERYGPEECGYGVSIDTDAYFRTSEPLEDIIAHYFSPLRKKHLNIAKTFGKNNVVLGNHIYDGEGKTESAGAWAVPEY